LKVPFIAKGSSRSASDHVQGSGENAGSGQTASGTWGKNWSGFFLPMTSNFLTFFFSSSFYPFFPFFGRISLF